MLWWHAIKFKKQPVLVLNCIYQCISQYFITIFQENILCVETRFCHQTDLSPKICLGKGGVVFYVGPSYYRIDTVFIQILPHPFSPLTGEATLISSLWRHLSVGGWNLSGSRQTFSSQIDTLKQEKRTTLRLGATLTKAKL